MGRRSHICVFPVSLDASREFLCTFFHLADFFLLPEPLRCEKSSTFPSSPELQKREKKKSGLRLINISEPFEYRHDKRAILNLNF